MSTRRSNLHTPLDTLLTFYIGKVKLRGLYMFEKLLTGIDLHSLEGIFSIEKVDNLLDILCSIYL